MTMNCTQAKREIALWVGSDLDEQQVAPLRQHLAHCECCRGHWRQIKRSLLALQQPGEIETAERVESVWPAVATRLPSREALRRGSEFNGWLPATAVAAACLAVLVFVRSGPPTSRRPYEQSGLELQGGRAAPPVFRIDGPPPPTDVRPQRDGSGLFDSASSRDRSAFFPPLPRHRLDDRSRRVEPSPFELHLYDR